MKKKIWVTLGILFSTACTVISVDAQEMENSAKEILEKSELKGGFIVHVGCGEGRLTAALRDGDRFLVQGLDSDPGNVRKAREYLVRSGVYGPVSVDRFNGTSLPYVEGLVNLLVVEEGTRVPQEEMMRVLAPRGALCVKEKGSWTSHRKPWPKQIDEWTHYLHDATNNAVSHDERVGPPRGLRWVGSPRWARHHDRMASMNALVSSQGRLFYVFDEGPTAAVMLPAEWTLIARDAFNGTILWKRDLPSWHPHLWPMKSGFAQLPRRLVAVEEKVYLPWGMEAPLVCLDAATGRTMRTYEDTSNTEEVLYSEGVLFVVVNRNEAIHKDFFPTEKNTMWHAMRRAAHDWPWDSGEREILALHADTGTLLWKFQAPVVPLSLTVTSRSVLFHDGEALVRLDREKGDPIWRSQPLSIGFPKGDFAGAAKKAEEVWRPEGLSTFVPASFGPTVVVQDGTVVFSGGDGRLIALSEETGDLLWDEEQQPSGHFTPQDVFIIQGVVWSGAIALPEKFHSGAFVGRDLQTGEVKAELPCDTDVYFMHQRCYRSKATDRYFIPSRTGIEFIDRKEGHWDIHHWVRGGCLYGIMPCNGLVYAPPHSCACYMMSKLNGFNALSSSVPVAHRSDTGDSEGRLEKGPSFAETPSIAESLREDDWPTYRHDVSRTGATSCRVSTDLHVTWELPVAGRLSAPVVAKGVVYVGLIDEHQVCAVDAQKGSLLWRFVAGGRVDSPPTIHKGRVLFGCADGWVYCVRASDGSLMWRFLAAPGMEKLMAFEQIESVWPLHGSVLVKDNAVFCVAGRSMFLDGGLRLLKLNVETGDLQWERVLDERDPATGETLQSFIMGHNMPVALPDILSSDGDHLYMRTQCFEMDGKRKEFAPLSADNNVEAAFHRPEAMHLFSPIGFLDGSWWHRAYWVYGERFATGAGGYPQAGKSAAAGRILVFDEESVYGFGRKPVYFRWTTPLEYRLFRADRTLEKTEVPIGRPQPGKERRKIPGTVPVFDWNEEVPLLVRGMVLANDVLFLSGPPDVVDEESAFHRLNQEAFQKCLARQSAALEGKEGALLCAVSPSDGERIRSFSLPSPPVWDGMAAAQSALFVSTLDGKLLCLGKEGNALPEAPMEGTQYERPDLVGYWPFDEGEGRVAKDASERCYDAMVRGQWTTGIEGSAVQFQSGEEWVEISEGEDLNINQEITLMAWIKPGTQESRLPMIVTKLGKWGRYILRLDPALHLVSLFWKGEEQVAAIHSEEAISMDWNHVAATYDPLGEGKLRLYINGVKVKETDAAKAWGDPSDGQAAIGGKGQQSFRGAIDEVRIYNRALSGKEIEGIHRLHADAAGEDR